MPLLFNDLLPVTETKGDVTKRLYTTIRSKIGSGELRQNERMPSQREMAHHLKVSRGVVVTVYEQLLADDLLGTAKGVGTFVKCLPKPTDTRKPAASSTRFNLFQRAYRSPCDNRNLLAPGHYHPDLFPARQWQSAQQMARRNMTCTTETQELDDWLIRSFVCRQLREHNAINCCPDNILLTSGTWPAISLIASTLAGPGDTCLVEDPIHPLACAALRFAGLTVKEFLPNDSFEGELGPEYGRPRLLLTSSAIHFPLGVAVPEERKQRILDWANSNGTIVIEDDYEGSFGIYGSNTTTYFSLNSKNTSIYVGSIGKLFSYRCRAGFMVAPAELIDRLRSLQTFMGMRAQPEAMAILAEFARRGYFSEHLQRLRNSVAQRRQLLLDFWNNGKTMLPTLHSAGIHISLPSVTNAPSRATERDQRRGNASLLGARFLGDYSIRNQHDDRIVLGMSNITERNVELVVKTLSPIYYHT